jgi:hypothetical protein
LPEEAIPTEMEEYCGHLTAKHLFDEGKSKVTVKL